MQVTMVKQAVIIFVVAAAVFATAVKAQSASSSSSGSSSSGGGGGGKSKVTAAVIFWDLGMGLAMCVIALVGAFGLLVPKQHITKFTKPLIAFAAGALLGGALFHMLPSAVVALGTSATPYAIAVLGFCVFLAVEETIHWLYNRKSAKETAAGAGGNDSEACGCESGVALPDTALNAAADGSKPTPCQQVRVCEGAEPCACPSHHLDRSKLSLAWLILVGDGLHNFFGGLAIGSTYMNDAGAGWASWVAAALHELPQELGDFAVLVHAGLDAKKALLYNFIAALPFLLGTMLSAAIGSSVCKYFIPFGAGNFLYIGATALLPEVHLQKKPKAMLMTFGCFVLGIAVLLAVRLGFAGW